MVKACSCCNSMQVAVVDQKPDNYLNEVALLGLHGVGNMCTVRSRCLNYSLIYSCVSYLFTIRKALAIKIPKIISSTIPTSLAGVLL